MVATLERDFAEFLDAPDAIAEYLTAVFEEGDPKFIAESIGVVCGCTPSRSSARSL